MEDLEWRAQRVRRIWRVRSAWPSRVGCQAGLRPPLHGRRLPDLTRAGCIPHLAIWRSGRNRTHGAPGGFSARPMETRAFSDDEVGMASPDRNLGRRRRCCAHKFSSSSLATLQYRRVNAIPRAADGGLTADTVTRRDAECRVAWLLPLHQYKMRDVATDTHRISRSPVTEHTHHSSVLTLPACPHPAHNARLWTRRRGPAQRLRARVR
jgi:hypothetical protein